MNRLLIIVGLLMLAAASWGQEVLLPVAYPHSGTKAASVCELPFFDDFSNYDGCPKQELWSSTSPFVSKGYGELPPTLGVVTLDAVDADGRLHNDSGLGLFGGDTLMSNVVRLDSLTAAIRKRLQPSDSVYLSFYYLPGGGSGNMWERNGDEPEPEDSLMLELYNPTTQQWDMVWGRGGISVDTLVARTGRAWQYVAIPITNQVYFSSQFRFRFRNYCTLEAVSKTGMVGNSDHWHLDYIYLNYNRHKGDQKVNDVAFVEPAPSLLKKYQAMPARQYRPSEMKNSLKMTITNLYSNPVAVRYTYAVMDEDGNPLHNYDGGNDNVPCYFPNGVYQTSAAHASPVLNYQYPQTPAAHTYTIRHVVRGSVNSDDHPQNDTTIFTQVLSNYYAYDDGVAENGYGLTSTSSKVKLAYGFDLNQSDTLTALDLYFNRTRGAENEDIKFYICVWADNNGMPGALLYKDTQKRKPSFDGLNKYVRYVLEESLVVSGTVYVGLEQTTNDYINLGFDRGNDARSHMFYQTSGGWQQSILKGAMMMRPYFGREATVGIIEDYPIHVSLYPNPAHDMVNIDCDGHYMVEMYDMKGSRILAQENADRVDLGNVRKGIYILKLTDYYTGRTVVKKIIVN